MKKLLLFITILSINIGAINAQRVHETFYSANVQYKITSISPNEVETNRYNSYGNTKDLTIPASVSYKGKSFSVTSLGVISLQYKGLTSIKLPNNLKTIKTSALAGNKLTSIEIPNKVTSIDRSAFASNKLTSVKIPGSVSEIGDHAFRSNEIKSITLPNSLTKLGRYSFMFNQIEEVTYISDRPVTLGWYAMGNRSAKEKITLNIPYGTTETFKNEKWTGFKNYNEQSRGDLVFPGTTFEIDHVKYKVTSTNPYEVRTVSYSGTSKSVSIPGQVTFNNYTFTVTKIDYVTFYGRGLTSITLPNTLRSIGSYAFAYNQLTSVYIPDNITEIGHAAFIGNKLTNVHISENATIISSFAFYKNELTSVTLPKNVKEMFYLVFRNNNLTSVTSLSRTPSKLRYAFENKSNIVLTIPSGTATAYKNANWTGFKEIREVSSYAARGAKPTATSSTSLQNEENSLEETATGIENMDITNAISVYPNPASKQLFIKSGSTLEIQSIEVFNTMGKTVQSIKGNASSIDVSNLSKGVYFVKVNSNEGSGIRKFVKQ